MKTSFKNFRNALSKEEMKKITGGYGGTCGYRPGDTWASYGYEPMCGISQSEAQSLAASTGGWWCCDSCAGNGGSASYC